MMDFSLEELAKTKGRILGVDFGDVRTGLALSDPGRSLASGVKTISPGGLEKTAAAVASEAKRLAAVAIVVGLPKNMDGSVGFRADRCKQFAERHSSLAESIPVLLFDERLTTVSASRFLNETNTREKARKEVVDTLSAEILLQDLLNRLKNLS